MEQTLTSDLRSELNGVSLTYIHYLHNPIIHLFYHPKIFHFKTSQEKSKTMPMLFFFWWGGGGGLKEVYYGVCTSGKYIHLIPKWPPFKYSFVFIQISP